jgi:hypothetical protein
MKLSNPITWAVVGAFIGFFVAIGGEDSRIIDGIAGALIQSVIWFGLSWVIIRILKNYPIKSSEKDVNIAVIKSKKFSLKTWFLILFSIPTIGAFVSEWESAGYAGLSITFFEQLSNLSTRVFSLAGLIDIFIFPSLASAITVTSAIFFYRKTSAKLKKQNSKFILVSLYVFATIIVWILLSMLLAVLIN